MRSTVPPYAERMQYSENCDVVVSVLVSARGELKSELEVPLQRLRTDFSTSSRLLRPLQNSQQRLETLVSNK